MNSAQRNGVLSRRQREKNARAKEILKAARDLFNVKGYHNTTLEEIAQHAEFGKGTIYNYFPSKESLFYGIIDELAQEVLEIAHSSVAPPRSTAREQLMAYGEAIVSHARENSDLFHLVFQEIHRLDSRAYIERVKQLRSRARRVWKIIARTLEKEMRAGKLRRADPLKLVELFDSMVRLFSLNQHGSSRLMTDRELHDAVSFIVSIFFDGIVDRKYND